MNTLEDQVSELSYLADLAMPLQSVAQLGNMEISASSSPTAGSNNNKKRKADKGATSAAPQPRAKRNRYINQACNECKRRKIKCNGNTPCQRCGHLQLECLYAPNCCANGNFKDTEDFKRMNEHINSLQEQVDALVAALNALRNGESLDAMSFSRPDDRSVSINSVNSASPYHQSSVVPRQPRFQGPTSNQFGLEVAKTTLQSMGYTDGAIDEGTIIEDDEPLASPLARSAFLPAHPSKDPLWTIPKDEAIRLCHVYEEEMGLMYPVVEIETVLRNTTSLYSFLEAAQRSGFARLSLPGSDTMKDANCSVLKLILATAMTVEGSGHSETGAILFESVREAVDIILHSGNFAIKDLPLLVLCAMYHFHCDQEALAWRIIGHTARMCMELGLHRRDAFLKRVTDGAERTSVTKLFWSIYVLDRRWSFGTGMPFALQDDDIDDALPEPDHAQNSYLCTMISYSRIGSTVWRSVGVFESAGSGDPTKKMDIGYLDYRILEWHKNISPELQLPTTDSPHTPSRAMHRLQILLYLRANQMRILIYRPVLHSANSILENMPHAKTVVELAKDTIRALTHLNQTTDIYRTQQVCFNYFLVSAVAVLFLAVVHNPVTFSATVKDEWAMATELVRGFREGSCVIKRLWRTFKGLREFAPRLGLTLATQDVQSIPTSANRGVAEEDPHSSAALAMAGLAGFGMGMGMGNGNSGGGGGAAAGGEWGDNTGIGVGIGLQITTEMTNLFEAALGGSGGGGGGRYSGVVDEAGGAAMGAGVGAGGGGMNGHHNALGGAGADDDLYRHMRELF